MVVVLVALFIIVPFVELAVFIQVAASIGFLPSVALIVVFSVAGAWLVKREGISIWRRARAQLDRGELPAREMVDGLLVLCAGALLLVPGFVTDILGLILLIPPSRALVRLVAMRRFERRVRAAFDASASAAANTFGSPLGATFVQPRVRTGDATYRGGPGFIDVGEVIGDDSLGRGGSASDGGPNSPNSSPSTSSDGAADRASRGRPERPPELGRY